MLKKSVSDYMGEISNIRNRQIEERVRELAKYIIENHATVRQAAKQFGISKSTVHMDVSRRLKYISPSMAAEVQQILAVNKAERHIRGGLATREKYIKCKEYL